MESEVNKHYAITVIIPVYNVRNYIDRCAESLMKQTLKDVQFIFVDDATPDDSISILRSVLERYPARAKDVVIISHNENKGLPAARNTGLIRAKGKYVFHFDSDDYAESSMLNDMYDFAEANNADIVWSDWYMSLATSEKYMSMPDFANKEDAIKAMLSGGMKYNVWNKLVKRNLYSDNCITFPAGYGMGEDLTMIKVFACAEKAMHLPKAYYHYNKTNATAFSQTYSSTHLIELSHNIDDVIQFVKENLGMQFEREISFLKLEAKFPFLLSPDMEKIKIWKSWYPEANKFINQNKYISTKNRWLQLFAKNNLWILVRAYNFMFNKVVYGLIYR